MKAGAGSRNAQTLRAQALVNECVVAAQSWILIHSLAAPSLRRQRLARWVTDFFNTLLDQLRHRTVPIDKILRTAREIGDRRVVRIDSHLVIQRREHFTEVHRPLASLSS